MGGVRLFHTISYKHEQYRDGKYGVTPSDTYTNFDLRVKYYLSLKNALEENHLNGYLEGYLDDHSLHGKALLESISQLDKSSVGPIQKVKNGYSIRTGVEGVGSYYYIIIKENGILLYEFPYNINPIKSLQKNKPLNILSDEDRNKFKQSIIESTSSINKSIDKEKLPQTNNIQELTQSTPLKFGATKDVKEEFIPLGFSDNKKFSYLSKLFSDGTGCNYWSFNILDLSNDKVIKHIETAPDGCYLTDKADLEKQFMTKVEAELQKHGITKYGEIEIKPFPFVSSVQEFNVCFSKKTEKIKEGVAIKTLRNLIAYNKGGALKILGVFEEIEFGGSLQIYNPKIEGYFKNPKYDRLAVVVSYSMRGTDGPPNFRRVKIFGSTLTIKENTEISETCSDINPSVKQITTPQTKAQEPAEITELKQIKKPTPKEPASQTKNATPKPIEITKQKLDTNPSKNTEVIKAEKAEPIKSAKGSISLVF